MDTHRKTLQQLHGGAMTPKEFCERMIKEWQAKSREASENADLAAFEQAEQELSNYTEMLKRYDTDIT
jgi:hypothetical protein